MRITMGIFCTQEDRGSASSNATQGYSTQPVFQVENKSPAVTVAGPKYENSINIECQGMHASNEEGHVSPQVVDPVDIYSCDIVVLARSRRVRQRRRRSDSL
jgi:hypothetical protein